MTKTEHKLELVSLITNLMKEIDFKPLHPKNKILTYTLATSYRSSRGI